MGGNFALPISLGVSPVPNVGASGLQEVSAMQTGERQQDTTNNDSASPGNSEAMLEKSDNGTGNESEANETAIPASQVPQVSRKGNIFCKHI